MFNQGGLTGPRLPDDRHTFPFADLERDLFQGFSFQGGSRVIDVGQVFNPDDRIRKGDPQSVTL